MKQILIVDDEPNLLAGLKRQLRQTFQVVTAPSGAEGLVALGNGEAFSVVVADMNMPAMNGAEFLARVKVQAPQVVRLMLTGNADQHTAAQAVNEGNIFRFLTKPCGPDQLLPALHAAVRHHELIIAEKELLEKTLAGSVTVLTEILALVEPQSVGRIQWLHEGLGQLASQLGITPGWEIEIAARLSQVGWVTVPPQIHLKSRAGLPLSEAEQQIVARTPEIVSRLLSHIPRLDGVARILRYQHKHYDGSGHPADPVSGQEIPQGARMIKLLADLGEIEAKGCSRLVALETLRNRPGHYDPIMLDAAFACFAGTSDVDNSSPASLAIGLKDLRPGDMLVSSVETEDGSVVAFKGSMITQPLIEKILNQARLSAIKEPIYIEKE